eukprot:108383-Pyramimonas_sp.AAC.1
MEAPGGIGLQGRWGHPAQRGAEVLPRRGRRSLRGVRRQGEAGVSVFGGGLSPGLGVRRRW